MKQTFLSLVVLLCYGCIAVPARGPDDAGNLISAEELKSTIQQLDEPATEMAALGKLIKVAGLVLYNNLTIATSDRAADEIREAAARAVYSHHNLERVGRALSNDDRNIRYWGVMFFAHEGRDPWKPLIPLMEKIAGSHDEDVGIRTRAIERLQSFEEAAGFLTKLQDSPGETDPWLLMVLLRFNSQEPVRQARWYARAVECLSGKDEAVRVLWLQVIWGNVANSSTAPMWRIHGDPALVEKLRQIAMTGPEKEKEAASGALKALAIPVSP